MADEIAVTPVEPQAPVATPLYVSKAQKVSDELNKGFGPKPLDSNPEQDKPTPAPVTSDQVKPEANDLEDILNAKKGIVKLDKKDKSEERKAEIQSDIDRLMAQKKELEHELSKSKSQQEQLKAAPESANKKERVFSREELVNALGTFVQEQDTEGMLNVFEYMLEEKEKKYQELVEYINGEKQVKKQQEEVSNEWKQIIKDYSNYDDEVLKGDKDFDITNKEGKLYRLAAALYDDPELGKKYKVQNGQSLAVRDAYTDLLKERIKRPSSKKKEINNSLANQLEKEKMKNASGSGSDTIEEVDAPSIVSEGDKLAAELKHRRDFQKKRMRGTGF